MRAAAVVLFLGAATAAACSFNMVLYSHTAAGPSKAPG